MIDGNAAAPQACRIRRACRARHFATSAFGGRRWVPVVCTQTHLTVVFFGIDLFAQTVIASAVRADGGRRHFLVAWTFTVRGAARVEFVRVIAVLERAIVERIRVGFEWVGRHAKLLGALDVRAINRGLLGAICEVAAGLVVVVRRTRADLTRIRRLHVLAHRVSVAKELTFYMRTGDDEISRSARLSRVHSASALIEMGVITILLEVRLDLRRTLVAHGTLVAALICEDGSATLLTVVFEESVLETWRAVNCGL